MIGLSASSLYADPKTTPLEREERDADLRGKIEQIRAEFPRAGYRMLRVHLRRAGLNVGERRLRRILRESGLCVKPLKKFVRTTDSAHSHRVPPNLLEEMTVDGPDQVWAADITYVRILNGFVYLAVVIDLWSRKIVGWQISKRIDRNLTLDALEMAIERRKPKAGLIHHSDRGVRYLCGDYVEELGRAGIRTSCSRKGNPYDNAWTESFMKTLKNDEVDLRKYETIIDVIDRVPAFIEDVYNAKRPHSSLGYLTPEEFEERYGNTKSTDQPAFTL